MRQVLTKIDNNSIPAPLREIPHPPTELWLEGNLPSLTENIWLTVVGSRKVSSYGKDACEKLISGLAGYPIVIVSGLAVGTDTCAHQAAIKNSLITVGFPGSGLNRPAIYPAVNRKLADEIIAAGGALVSEYDPDMKATLYTFPQRNRLMAGISKATLIIEAGEKSGTLITARLALDYNRDVLALPGSIFSSGSTGTNKLIRQGATPITSSEDILEALGFDIEKANDDRQQSLFSELSDKEKLVVEIVSLEPTPRDELIRELGLDTPAANSLLGLMEIKGIIIERGGEFRVV